MTPDDLKRRRQDCYLRQGAPGKRAGGHQSPPPGTEGGGGPAQGVGAPWGGRLTLSGARSQEEMWADTRFPGLTTAAVTLAEDESPEGYRFAADFTPVTGMGPAGFFILGGGQLDLYA